MSRVHSGGEEDDTDGHVNEFNFQNHKHDQCQTAAEAMLHARMSFGRANNPTYTMDSNQEPVRLTNKEMGHDNDHDIPEDHHATVIPPLPGGGGKRVHPLPYADPSIEVQTKLLNPNNGIGAHKFGNVWKERVQSWRERKEKSHITITQGECQGSEGKGDPYGKPIMDEARQPLSRKVSIQSSLINPYRMVIVIRLVVLGFFFHYRLLNPVRNAYSLWLTSVICEIWFAFSWILDQFPKWFPITRETYLDRFSLRYEPEGEPSQFLLVQWIR